MDGGQRSWLRSIVRKICVIHSQRGGHYYAHIISSTIRITIGIIISIIWAMSVIIRVWL